jgi:hypothetical protein
MTESLTLDHELWKLIRNLTGVAASLDDSTDEGVWLCEAPIDDDGDTIGVHAVVETAEFHLSVRLSTRPAGDDDSLLCVPISRRTAMFAAEFGEDDGEITVVFDDERTATVTAAQMVMSIESTTTDSAPAEVEPRPTLPDIGVSNHDLIRLLTAATYGTGGAHDNGVDQPLTWFSIDASGELIISRDWRPFGGGRSTLRTAGEILSIDHRHDATDPESAGIIAQAATRHLAAITRALHLLWPSTSTIGVHLPRTAGDDLVVATDVWALAVPTSVAPAVAAVDRVEGRFGYDGWNCERVDPLSVIIGQFPDLLRVDALEGTPTRLRCTTVIATGVEPTTELFTELNAINAGLTDIKTWFDDGRIIIGVDTADIDPAAVSEAWTKLTQETTHLGDLLGALGAEMSTT